MKASDKGRSVLFIDMAYCLDEVLERGHFQFFEARHSNGYFDRVFAVHPLADRVTRLDAEVVSLTFSPRQKVIEARSASGRLPRLLMPLDFVLTQRRLVKRLSRLIEDEGIEVIAATDAIYSGLFGYWLKKATGRPLIVYIVMHYRFVYESTKTLAMPRLFPFYRMQAWVTRKVLQNTDLVAPGTKTLAEYAIESGADPARVHVFPVSKFVNPAHHIPREQRESAQPLLDRLGIEPAQPLFLTIARLDAVKLVDHSIRAMRMIANRHPAAVLLIAGRGPEQEALEALTKSLGLEKNVRFMGLTSQEDLAALSPHVISMSPYTGIALFETSLGGAPAIAYDADAQVSELVRTGETGLLVPFKDWEALGRAGIAMLDNREATIQMGANMRRHAVELTDPDTVYAREHALFEEMFAGRRTDASNNR
ncbi:MAG: hypothetical protein DI591_11915 [Citromicrobium sp.]|nr:MAG: hypothetical protein DI591_11915 [Citromicrobium sp.]